MRRAINYLAYFLVRIIICVLQAVPIETAEKGAVFLGGVCTRLGLRKKVVEDNIQNAFPDWTDDQIRLCVRRMWEHLFLLVVEVAHVPRKLHDSNWRDYVSLKGVAPLVRQLNTGRPVILVTGHFGNFEVGGYLLGLLGYPTYTIARTLDNSYIHEFVKRFRGATGQYLIPKNDGYDQILQVMEDKGTLALLADQAAGPKGCWVDFFNRPASTYKAIALFSLDYDAPISVVYSRRQVGRPMRFTMEAVEMFDPKTPDDPRQSIREITQWFTRMLEEGIRETPDQYWWVHRRWKTYGRKRKRKIAASSDK
jgi:Kdo2-lipid IVA lauroyltransferase/acyltransferase